MNILIIENENPAASKLQHLLKKIDNSIQIAGVTETVEESVNWLQSKPKPDLILVDIQLDDGISFEIFETIQVDIPVIFTTAYNEYVLQAFKVNSVDYLLKPIDEHALRTALDKFKKVHYKVNRDLLKSVFNEYKNQFKNRFLIKIGARYKSVSIKEVCCFYIEDRAVFLKTFEGKNYAIDYSLDQLENILDPDQFFRLNRKCILFLNAIEDILSYSSSRLQVRLGNKNNMIEKTFLVVSRDKVKDFKKWIDR